MAWGRKSGGGEGAGGTDWSAKKASAGSAVDRARDHGMGEDWGKPETSGGSGGTLSDGELREQGLA